jgi:hypothetical protein
MTTMTIAVCKLQAGDYVVPAKATVKDVQNFAGLSIVDFTDNSATAPLPQNIAVEIQRSTTC